MWAFLAKTIDRCVIRAGGWRLGRRPIRDSRVDRARALLESPDFFAAPAPPERLEFANATDFTFESPVEGADPLCRRVCGRFFRCGEDWRGKPSVLLLHGWNGERVCHVLFALWARRLNRSGVNVMTFELPYHGRRRPREGGLTADFISSDLERMMLSTRQAFVDARALVRWLARESAAPVGILGISLGGWLAGLLACREEALRCAVLMTPLVRLDEAIRGLGFCEPIRRSLENGEVSLEGLNLTGRRPAMDTRNVLLVEARHDLFVTPASVEELREAWRGAQIERFNHGHISILGSRGAFDATRRFMVESMAR